MSGAVVRRLAVVLAIVAATAVVAVVLLLSVPARHGATDHPAARALVVEVDDVVLGVGADETERRLAWFSADPGVRCVRVAARDGGPAVTVPAYDSGAGREGMTWHHATLAGLGPSTTYGYRLGDCDDAWTAPYTFTTGGDDALSFWVFGDPQVGTETGELGAGWARTLAQAARRAPATDFLITTGDQVSTTDAATQATEWAAFLAPVQLTRYPSAPVIGNHDEAGGTGALFGQHFALPNLGDAGETVAGSGDYWFTHDDVLFLMLNSQSLDLEAHEAFMEEALDANPGAEWSVVVLHRGPFSAGPHVADPEVVELREELAPILSDLEIDLVLSGHDHVHARSFLMDGTRVIADSGGPTVVADHDDVLYVTANSSSGSRYYDVTSGLPWIAEARQDRTPSYLLVRVRDDAVVLTTYRASDASVIDRVTLRREE